MELDSAVGLLILQLLRCLANFFHNFQVLLRNAQSEILELVVGLTLSPWFQLCSPQYVLWWNGKAVQRLVKRYRPGGGARNIAKWWNDMKQFNVWYRLWPLTTLWRWKISLGGLFRRQELCELLIWCDSQFLYYKSPLTYSVSNFQMTGVTVRDQHLFQVDLMQPNLDLQRKFEAALVLPSSLAPTWKMILSKCSHMYTIHIAEPVFQNSWILIENRESLCFRIGWCAWTLAPSFQSRRLTVFLA